MHAQLDCCMHDLFPFLPGPIKSSCEVAITHADFLSKMFIATVLSHLMEVRCYFSFSAFQSGLQLVLCLHPMRLQSWLFYAGFLWVHHSQAHILHNDISPSKCEPTQTSFPLHNLSDGEGGHITGTLSAHQQGLLALQFGVHNTTQVRQRLHF